MAVISKWKALRGVEASSYCLCRLGQDIWPRQKAWRNGVSRQVIMSTKINSPNGSERKTRILIVEDEPAMVQGLRDNFEYEGYEVISAADGVDGLNRAIADQPDLVVLDVMMPKMSGLDVCKQLKARKPSMPIIMLTARGQEIDKVVGLELGADDYVTKPFSIRELMARVKAVLRRAHAAPKDKELYKFGDVEVNLRSCQVSRKGKPVDVSSKEFELLKYFLCHSGEAISRDKLLEEVWGYDRFPTTRTVDAHIVRLRQKVEVKPEDPHFILTVHGVGYKFVG